MLLFIDWTVSKEISGFVRSSQVYLIYKLAMMVYNESSGASAKLPRTKSFYLYAWLPGEPMVSLKLVLSEAPFHFKLLNVTTRFSDEESLLILKEHCLVFVVVWL
jgi:hypothetical protein